jgi:hypothetical protein
MVDEFSAPTQSSKRSNRHVRTWQEERPRTDTVVKISYAGTGAMANAVNPADAAGRRNVSECFGNAIPLVSGCKLHCQINEPHSFVPVFLTHPRQRYSVRRRKFERQLSEYV